MDNKTILNGKFEVTTEGEIKGTPQNRGLYARRTIELKISRSGLSAYERGVREPDLETLKNCRLF